MNQNPCPTCGDRHPPGTLSCEDVPLAGRSLPTGLWVSAKVGETSLGPLYHAEDVESGAEVTLVVLGSGRSPQTDSGDDDALTLLQERLRRAAGIRHPNVASIHSAGETPEGLPYIAFEVFQGRLLPEHVATAPLSIGEAAELCLQAARGLQAVHAAGLVHGNLSPDAILLTRTEGHRPLVKLIRFGVIQDSVGPLGADEHPSPYASPERLAGEPTDERSDVFSLGAVLHYLITREPPGTGAAEPVHPGLRSVLIKALAASPAERYQTIEEFARALKRQTKWTRLRLRGTTSRVVATATAAAVVAIGAGVLVPLVKARGSTPPPPPAAVASAVEALPRSPVEVSGRVDSVTPIAAPSRRTAPDRPTTRSSRRPQRPPPGRTAVPDTVGPRAASPTVTQIPPRPAITAGDSMAIGLGALPAPVDSIPPPVLTREPPSPPPPSISPSAAPAVPAAPPPGSREGRTAAVQPRSDTAAGAEADRGGITRALAEYGRALESKDLKEVQRVYPGITTRERTAWEQFFSVAGDVEVTLAIERLTLKGSEAELAVRGVYRYWNRSLNEVEESPVSFSATARRSARGWQLSVIR